MEDNLLHGRGLKYIAGHQQNILTIIVSFQQRTFGIEVFNLMQPQQANQLDPELGTAQPQLVPFNDALQV